MSLSNFIKSILNIQDNNISFLEEDYCQVIQNGNYVVKVFKGFLKADYFSCPHCSSKNIVKNGSRERNIKFIPFQNYNIELNLSVQNNFKRFENIVKKNLSKKEKVSKQMLTALKILKKYMKYIEKKRIAFGYSNFSNFKKRVLIEAGIIQSMFNFLIQ